VNRNDEKATNCIFVFTLGVISGLFGLAIGSFLNVVIARVPEGRSVVSPGSSCPKCGHEITARDNIPVVSWLLLGRKCRSCREPISARYPMIELLTAALFVLVALVIGPEAHLPALPVFVAGGVALSAIDLDLMRLPNKVVFPTLYIVSALLILAAFLDRRFDRLAWSAAGAVIAFAALGTIRVIYPKGIGFGDVKLALLLGAVTGWFGPARVGLGLFLGYLIGATLGIVLMIASGKGRKHKFPFGPSLLVGALIAVLAGGPILDWYQRSSGL
jgi:leader peptidase (prepilin peptidase) / N-methyltransferase